MKNPSLGFLVAMLLASVISVLLFLLGAIAVAGIVPYREINCWHASSLHSAAS